LDGDAAEQYCNFVFVGDGVGVFGQLPRSRTHKSQGYLRKDAAGLVCACTALQALL